MAKTFSISGKLRDKSKIKIKNKFAGEPNIQKTLNAFNILLAQFKAVEKSIEEIKNFNEKINSEFEGEEKLNPDEAVSRYLVNLVRLKINSEIFKHINIDLLTGSDKEQLLTEQEELERWKAVILEDRLLAAVFENIVVTQNDSNKRYNVSFKSLPLMGYYIGKMKELDNDRRSNNRKYESQTVLINLCRAFEAFSLELYKIKIKDNPQDTELLKKTLTYEVMREFNSLEDARDSLIDDYLDKCFHGSLDFWFSKVSQSFQMATVFDNDKPAIIEAFLRRNLYVHANGKVNSLYLSKLPDTFTNTYKLGDEIESDLSYLANIFRIIENICWWMLYRASSIFCSSKGDCFSHINSMLLYNLERNIDSIPKIYKDLIKDSTLDLEKSKISEVNYYLFYKTNGRISEVHEELLNFDVSECPPKFQLVKEILIDAGDVEEKAIALFETLDDEDFLHTYDWPIMDFVKNTPEINNYFNMRLELCLNGKEN